MVETTNQRKSNFKVRVNLSSSTAIFPYYNTISEIPPTSEVSNNLVDITYKSALFCHTGDLLFSNDEDPRCPPGFSNLILKASPQAGFTENLALWWNEDRDTPENTKIVLEPFKLDILVKLKNKSYKFDVPTE